MGTSRNVIYSKSHRLGMIVLGETGIVDWCKRGLQALPETYIKGWPKPYDRIYAVSSVRRISGTVYDTEPPVP
jgi:hypothetical protein